MLIGLGIVVAVFAIVAYQKTNRIEAVLKEKGILEEGRNKNTQ
jgi:hypothetical protein